MQINDAHILVTGGCGLIGSTTVDLLLRDYSPAQIVILDNLTRGSLANVGAALKNPIVTLAKGDIRDIDTVRAVMRGMDAVIHMATLRVTACAAEPREALTVMCDGSFNVLEAAQLAGVKKVIAASSASVYGLAEIFPTTESHHPYNNRTWYGATKVMLEGLLRAFNDMYGLPYVALRYFNVYGPRMDLHGPSTEVFVRWIERVASGRSPLIFGDGNKTLDLIYVEDVARANLLSLESAASDEVVNIASGQETSLNDLAAALLQAMGVNAGCEYGVEREVTPVPRRLADTTKAERLLGFRPSVSLDEGLKLLVRWWNQSGEGS